MPQPFLMQFFDQVPNATSHTALIGAHFQRTAHAIVGMQQPEKRVDRETEVKVLSSKVVPYLPENPEQTWCGIHLSMTISLIGAGAHIDDVLRNLLMARDCAVRAITARGWSWE